MSDWRSGDSSKRKPKPVRSDGEVPKLSPQPADAWKGKGAKSAKPVSGPPTRTWKGQVNDAEALTASALRKWGAVGALSIVTILLTTYFWIVAFSKTPKLPLGVIAIKDYDAKELLDNPFADQQRTALRAVNPKNIAADWLLNKNQDDNALSYLKSLDWPQKFEKIGGKVIKPGGPSEKVVALYISAYAVFTVDRDLVLYTQKDNPFADGTDSGVKLATVLDNVASSMAKNSFAWIILDLQLPPVTTNLCDLSPSWRTSTERALASLEKDKLQRLIVTLPGDDGQQNWIAPEHSASFFGHYVRQLLEGHFAKKNFIDSELTVGQFKDLLGETVASQVNNRRFAQQNPLWLPKENVEKALQIKLVAVPKGNKSAENKTEFGTANWNTVRRLWEQLNYQEFSRAYRWDPIGYAKAESQLLALEEIAFSRPSSFVKASQIVEDAIVAIKKPVVDLQVSLIEDRARNRYFHDKKKRYDEIDALATKLLDKLAQSEEEVPGFWKSPAQAEPAEKKPLPEMELSNDERPMLVWQLYAFAAKRQLDSLWKKVFTRQRLRDAIQYCDQRDDGWLEINLLRRIENDIDWELPVSDRVTACAKSIELFSRIQSLSTIVEPEVSWWLEQSKTKVEATFLRGFDHLLANQAVESLARFSGPQFAEDLANLEARLNRLNEVVEAMHESLHDAPHLLAYLLREYQFSDEKDSVEKQLARLGSLVDQVEQLYQTLAATTSRDEEGIDRFLNTANSIRSDLEFLHTAYTDYVEAKTDAKKMVASNSPQTFRRNRIALMSPLLAVEYRANIHESIVAFLKNNASEIDGNPTSGSGQPSLAASERDLAAGALKFLEAIDSKFRDKWERIVRHDTRLGWGQIEEYLAPRVLEPSTLTADLIKSDCWLRSFSAACGANPSRTEYLQNNHAYDRWQFSTTHYKYWQVNRLAEASWGNGGYTDQSPHSHFYFFKQADKYRSQIDTAAADVTEKLSSTIRTKMQQVLSASVARLMSMQAKFGSASQSISNSVEPIDLRVEIKDPWNGVAQVYMRDVQGKRLSWLRTQPKEKAWVVDLNQGEKNLQTKKLFDISYWKSSSQPPWGDIAMRGNIRSTKLDWKVTDQETLAIQLAMERDKVKPATLKVVSPAKKPPINVLILIDCSLSMEMKVKRQAEGGDVTEEALFALVKGDVIRVLERLAQMHGRDAEVKLGIIPFGLSNSAIEAEFKSLLVVAPENQIHPPKTMRLLDDNWFRTMKRLVQRLVASGETPLYEAINVAYKTAPDQTSLVFVFSDGVNYVSNKSLRLTSVDDLRQKIIKNSNIRLSIFHYDFFKPWVEDKEDAAFWKSVYDKGKEELVSLGSTGNAKYGFYGLDEWEKLKQDSLAFIPRSVVSVVSTSSSSGKVFKTDTQNLDTIIDIDQSFLPADLEVQVSGPFGNATAKITAFGGEQIQLYYNVDGGINRIAQAEFSPKGTIPPVKPLGGRLQSQLYLRPRNHPSVSVSESGSVTSNELRFELCFWNEKNPDEFTQRPRFIVGELSESDNPNSGTFVLADHRFMPETNYPEARLSDVPWPSGNPPPAAKLRIWASDTFPNLQEIGVGADSLKIGIANVRQMIDSNKVTAEVKYSATPQPKQRVVVICPNFDSSQRTYSAQQLFEKHEFILPEDMPSYSSQLRFTTIGELDEMVQRKELSRFVFDSIEVR
jgi:hypothetical protein